jgi:hypothetical protein
MSEYGTYGNKKNLKLSIGEFILKRSWVDSLGLKALSKLRESVSGEKGESE